MLLGGEHTRRLVQLVQLLADVFADALNLVAAGAPCIFRFVKDHGAWNCGGIGTRLGQLRNSAGPAGVLVALSSSSMAAMSVSSRLSS